MTNDHRLDHFPDIPVEIVQPQLATPGSILVSEQTHKLTAGYFEFKTLGKTQVKGVEEPLNVYEVLGAGPLRTRLQVSVRGLTYASPYKGQSRMALP